MDKNNQIVDILRELIAVPKSELNFTNNFELLIAVILSAQCTDKRVNEVTRVLFEIWDSPKKLANAKLEDVEKVVKPCGFYHNKSKNIIECSRQIMERHNGQVPENLEDLILLKGVGRKTANVILAVGFLKPAIAVDTHVNRVSKRLGLSEGKNVRQVENDLMKLFDAKDWGEIHHLLLLFGRYYCKSRVPKCAGCKLSKFCKYKKEGK